MWLFCLIYPTRAPEGRICVLLPPHCTSWCGLCTHGAPRARDVVMVRLVVIMTVVAVVIITVCVGGRAQSWLLISFQKAVIWNSLLSLSQECK